MPRKGHLMIGVFGCASISRPPTNGARRVPPFITLTNPMEENLMFLTALKLFSVVERRKRVSPPTRGRSPNGRKQRNPRLEVEQLETRMVLSPSGPPFDWSNA